MTSYLRQTAAERRDPDELPVAQRAKLALHLPKGQQASDKPGTLTHVRQAHEQALMLQMNPTGFRGYGSVFGLLGWAGVALMLANVRVLWKFDQTLFGAILAFVLICIAITGIVMSLYFFRLDLLTPQEIPLVFNRKTRKVHQIVPDAPKFEAPADLWNIAKNIFKPWPLVLIEHDWDCLEAEYWEQTALAGNVVRTDHVLQLYIKSRSYSDQVIGSIGLAPPAGMSKDLALSLWEHIRRFMEADGPPLSPGDIPAPKPPTNPIASMQAVLPYVWPLPVIGLIWSGQIFIEQGLFRMNPIDFMSKSRIGIWEFAAFLPSFFIVAAGCFNFIAHLLSPKLTLPPDVLAEAGAPVDLEALSKRLVAEQKAAAAAKGPEGPSS
jgi:hypothetical protein